MNVSSHAMQPEPVKTCIIGAPGVGKTSIVLQVISGSPTTDVRSVIGDTSAINTIGVIFEGFPLHIWDATGQKLSGHMEFVFYNRTKLVFAVFDVTNEQSFKSLRKLIYDMKKFRFLHEYCQICILANKTDKEGRVVTQEEGKDLAVSWGAIYHEVSAKENEGVKAAFIMATRLLEFRRRLIPYLRTTNDDAQPDNNVPNDVVGRKKCCCVIM